MVRIPQKYLKPTFCMNFNENPVKQKALELVNGISDENEIENIFESSQFFDFT